MRVIFYLTLLSGVVSCAGVDRFMASGNQTRNARGSDGIQGIDDATNGGGGTGNPDGDLGQMPNNGFPGDGGSGDGGSGGGGSGGGGFGGDGNAPGQNDPGQNDPGQSDPSTRYDDTLREMCAEGKDDNTIYARAYKIEDEIGNSFDFDNFNLKGEPKKDPNYKTLEPLEEAYCVEQVNFSQKNKNETPFETGGVTEGYYVKLLGRISFPESGEWKIFVKESEGVRVTLDDILVLNDEKAKDGFKEISSIPISFAAKSYRLKVDYFQAEGQNVGLELYWKGPGMDSKMIIPASAYVTE